MVETKAKDWREVPVDELSGKALSAAVAEEVMEWKRATFEEGTPTHHKWLGHGEIKRDYTLIGPPEWDGTSWEIGGPEEVYDGIGSVEPLPPFHAEIGAAWQVVERLGCVSLFEVDSFIMRSGEHTLTGWVAAADVEILAGYNEPDFIVPDDYGPVDFRFSQPAWFAATAPEAICKVALMSVRQDA